MRRRLTAATRREQLLSVALDEFGRRGFHLTQMEHVAAAAGVSKGLLYQHFESKEELFAAVTTSIVEDLSQRLHAVTNPGDPGLDRMRALAKTLFDFAIDQPGAWAVIVRHFDKPEVGDELRGLRDDLGAVIVDLMLLNRRNNPTRLAAAEPVVTLFAPIVTGGLMSLISWWLDHPEVPRERAETMAVDFIWLGLERIRAGERLP
ncbi:TetR/AcrR family transcriptional regulator [Cryptosporangium sp. NPDC048952]|uniref:TetR/AcrR family transcriptional regulator n=1 Tax=Cryptosporangium sp. NPDC048952 TaxID=3363961 RepID=UPI0037104A91